MKTQKSLILIAAALMISGTAFAKEAGSRRDTPTTEDYKTEYEKRKKAYDKVVAEADEARLLSDAEFDQIEPLQKKLADAVKKANADKKWSANEMAAIRKLQRQLNAKVGELKKNDEVAVGHLSRYDRRVQRQQQRLLDGVSKGEIDAAELTALLSQQARLAEMQKMAMADGKISKEEAKMLNELQNLASTDIKNARTPASVEPEVENPVVLDPVLLEPTTTEVVAEPLLPEEPLVTPEDLTLGSYETINDQPRVFKGYR